MSGLILALIGALLAGVGARDFVLIARLTGRQGRRPLVLVVALASAIGTTVAAVYASQALAAALPGPTRVFIAALAAGMAGIELIVIRPGRAPAEPTHSLGALAVVLLAQHIIDAARFLIFAIAVATRAPIPAALGGAFGSALLVTAAWLGGRDLAKHDLTPLRRIVGVALLIPALYVGLHSLGKI